jgi:hypoxanthine phosphoribosyltransferase
VLKERVLAKRRIEQVVAALAAEINADLEDREPVFICVLKGAVYFFAALTQRLSRSVVVDFIQASSYGATTESSGTVTMVKDITVDISGKDVYLVEDIVDTGLTLADLVALLSKPSRRKIDVRVDFIGLEIEDRFVVGYGLDFDQRFRNLPEIWEFIPDPEGP